MGYQLPVQPIQSQMYANRMENASPSFAYIDRIQSAKLQMEHEQWHSLLRRERNKDSEREFGKAPAGRRSMSPAKKGFIQPNPVALSKEIAEVVGKGIAVNEYA